MADDAKKKLDENPQKSSEVEKQETLGISLDFGGAAAKPDVKGEKPIAKENAAKVSPAAPVKQSQTNSQEEVKQQQSGEVQAKEAPAVKNTQATAEKESSIEKKDLQDILLEKGLVSPDQLMVARRQLEHEGKGRNLGDILVAMGFVTESALGEVISKTSGIEKFDIKSVVLDNRLIKKVPKEIALRYKVIPVAISARKVTVAVKDVFDVIAIDKVKKYFPKNFIIEPVYAPEADILEIIDQYYDYEMSIDGIIREIEGDKSNFEKDENAAAAQQTGEEDYRNPIVRLVDAILVDAVHIGASDIHFEPEEAFLRLRYRIDGRMTQIRAFHKDYWPPIAVRIKIMSGMNIAESRKAQDGHATANILGREVDFRVATQPTINGENFVLRILDKAKSLVTLDELGYSEHNQKLLKKLLKKPEGIIVVTGPTGSGKTTTLYSILSFINTVDTNIMTLEDPVEYELPLIRQTSVKEGSMTFVEGIKSLMRQDPDVIFVGEVRDSETADIAVRAAMTGHQVFTTLHTNNAVGVIPRLLDIGVRPFLLSGALVCCVAQRLCRKLCESCKTERVATEEECRIFGIDKTKPPKVYDSVGCEKCNNIGYKGRVALCEILPISKQIDEMIALGETTTQIIEQADKEGFVSMSQDGINKILAGLTTLDELTRSVDMTERL